MPQLIVIGKGNAIKGVEAAVKGSKYLINKSDFVNAVMRYMDKIAKLTVEEQFVRNKPLEKK